MSMIRVSIAVDSDASHFEALVRAESIEQAVSLARARYPGSEVRVEFPIDPETFFAGGRTGGQARPEVPGEVARIAPRRARIRVRNLSGKLER
jgi:hypothetical protein